MVLAKIEDQGWFNLQEDDLTPYPSAWDKGCSEPRWWTLLAFARDTAKNHDMISNEKWNNWRITSKGVEWVAKLIVKIENKDIDVSQCYLWTVAFKELLDASFAPSSNDKKRPKHIYKDNNPLYDLL